MGEPEPEEVGGMGGCTVPVEMLPFSCKPVEKEEHIARASHSVTDARSCQQKLCEQPFPLCHFDIRVLYVCTNTVICQLKFSAEKSDQNNIKTYR